jgi:hypothetical protein
MRWVLGAALAATLVAVHHARRMRRVERLGASSPRVSNSSSGRRPAASTSFSDRPSSRSMAMKGRPSWLPIS